MPTQPSLMRDCIICGKPINEQSVEHVLPDAVGGKTTIRTVCKKCNSLLGEKVDCLLTEDPAIQYLRAKFEIPNRDGNTISIMSFMKKAEYEDSCGEKLVIKNGDGEHMPKYYVGNPIPKVEIQRSEAGQYLTTWSAMDLESVNKKAKREFKKAGIPITDEQLASMLVTSANADFSYVALRKDVVAHFDRYIPCAIKIAYEAMCDYYPDYWKTDDLGRKYREYLCSAISGTKLDELTPPEPIISITDFLSAQNNHILIFRKLETDLFADVCFFCSLQYTVCVSHNAENYNLCGADTRAYFLA